MAQAEVAVNCKDFAALVGRSSRWVRLGIAQKKIPAEKIEKAAGRYGFEWDIPESAIETVKREIEGERRGRKCKT